MSFAIQLLGLTATSFTTLSPLPQVIKAWRTKSVKDVSLTMNLMLLSGLWLWIAYGLTISSIALVVGPIISAVLTISIVYLKLRYNDKSPPNGE